MDEQKDLEKLIKKVFEVDRLDAPSANFTATVLEKIEAEKKSKLAYKPLLSKKAFVVLGVLIVAFVAFVFSITDTAVPPVNYFESFDFSGTWLSEHISEFSFTTSFGYMMLTVGFLFCLQAGLVNKKLSGTNSLA